MFLNARTIIWLYDTALEICFGICLSISLLIDRLLEISPKVRNHYLPSIYLMIEGAILLIFLLYFIYLGSFETHIYVSTLWFIYVKFAQFDVLSYRVRADFSLSPSSTFLNNNVKYCILTAIKLLLTEINYNELIS